MNARSLPEMISVGDARTATATAAATAGPAAGPTAAPMAAPEGSGRWIDVCALEDIPRLGSRVIPRGSGHAVAVFRTSTDAVFALDDRCPHKGGPLSQGIVFGDRVACPLHNWNIRLETGAAVEPDVGCAARYPARVENGWVEVALDCATKVSMPDVSDISLHSGSEVPIGGAIEPALNGA